jgi:phage gp29-like protein
MAITLAPPPRKRSTSNQPDTRPINVVSVYDRYSTYPSSGLTPERLTQIFREADQGDVFRQSELFEEMLEKEPRMFGMFHTRQNGVLKWPSQIVPGGEEPQYIEHAQWATELLDNIRNLREAKQAILDAVPKGYSALWIGWKQEGNDISVDKLNFVHQKHFRWGIGSDPLSDLNQIRRITDQDRVKGIELEPNKWIVAVIKARSGHPSRSSILRTCAWMYLFKNFDVKAWLQFAEVFGMPIRIGKYPASEINNDKLLAELKRALQQLSLDASALIPDSTMIEFVEAAQKGASAALHQDLAHFCNDETSVAILGHTGGAEGTPGKLGGEETALEARLDLIEADAASLDDILTDQLIVPGINFRFGPQKKYPYHQTLVQRPVNRKDEAEVFDIAINRIRVPVSKKDVYERLGIPQPDEGDEVIVPPSQPVQNTFAGSTPLLHIIAADGSLKKK